MTYLLDTNVLLWLILGARDRLPRSTQKTLEDPVNRVVVSVASIWEIAIKRSIGKLNIDDTWLDTFRQLEFEILPINISHAAGIARLPWHHRDPFDRLLLSVAKSEQLTLITADKKLAAYDVDAVFL